MYCFLRVFHMCHNFWTNSGLEPFSTSKWPPELPFCERYKDNCKKTARNGRITDFCQCQILGNTLYLYYLCVLGVYRMSVSSKRWKCSGSHKTLIKTGIPFYFMNIDLSNILSNTIAWRDFLFLQVNDLISNCHVVFQSQNLLLAVAFPSLVPNLASRWRCSTKLNLQVAL